MKALKLLSVGLLLTYLYGCVVVTPNIGVKKEFWNDKNGVVGVAVTKLPEPMAHKAGAQGLLDIAINNANADDLETALKKENKSSIYELQDKLVSYLKSKGLNAKKVDSPIDLETLTELEKENDESKGIYFAARDFKPLKSSLGVDKLLVVQLNALGTIRSYYGFIPTSEPSGYAVLNGYVVNLDNNQLEWNNTVTQSVNHGAKEWDQPPEFTALVKAMHSAYNLSQTKLYENFSQ